jgi:hypothetical protein
MREPIHPPVILREASVIKPELSILMPVCNAESFLQEAIQSVLSQKTDFPFELIALDDDASKDRSLDILKKTDDARLTMAHLPGTSGLAVACNAALGLARAPWICRFDADDVMLPDTLGPYYHWTCSQPGAVWAYCALEVVDRHLKPMNQQLRNPFDLFKMVQRNILPHPMTLMKTAALRQAGGYDPSLRSCEDYDLWLRLLEFYQPVFYNQICMFYRQHTTNSGKINSSGDPALARLNARLQERSSDPQQERGRERLRRVKQFIEASDRNDFQMVRQLGAWLFQQGVEGFERDRRLAEAFLAGGDAATAMSLGMSWIQRASQGQFLLPYELKWALVFCMQLALRSRQTKQVTALLPVLEAVQGLHDSEIQTYIQQARQYLANTKN